MTTSGPVRRGFLHRARHGSPRATNAHPLRLRFSDPDLDREFREQYDTAAVPQAVMVGFVGLVVVASFGVLDAMVVEGDVSGVFVIRFGFICPAVLAFILALVVARDRAWRLVQAAMCAALTVAAFGLFAIPLVAEVPTYLTRTGMLLTLMFLCAFAPVRFVWAMW